MQTFAPTIDPTTLALKDIHLPESFSWWPLAIGWWVLLSVLLIFIFIFFLRHKKKKHTLLIVSAKREIDKIQTEFTVNGDKVLLICELSKLLRRVCISLFPRHEIASLTGDSWLQFLDRHDKNKSFSKGVGRVLIDAPYRKFTDYDEQQLINLVKSWLKESYKNKRNGSLK